MKNAILDGRKPMGNLIFGNSQCGLALVMWLTYGDDLNDPPPPRTYPPLIERDPRDLTFADVEPLIKVNCQGCHAPGGQMQNKPLITLYNLRSRAKDAWEELDRGQMPPSNSNFAFSIEGRVIAGWLRYGKDVRWRGGNGGRDDDDDDDDDDDEDDD